LPELSNWNAWHSQHYTSISSWSRWHLSGFIVIASKRLTNRNKFVGQEVKWRCVGNFSDYNIARAKFVFYAVNVSASDVS
jgi:hypothetical protein